jgi:hypothetical protein
MGGGKETPRQKMISMMYIVLTALLALNVSKQILEAYIAIEENIQLANISESDRGNDKWHAIFEKATDQTEKSQKAIELFKLAQELDKITAEQIQLLDEAKLKTLIALQEPQILPKKDGKKEIGVITDTRLVSIDGPKPGLKIGASKKGEPLTSIVPIRMNLRNVKGADKYDEGMRIMGIASPGTVAKPADGPEFYGLRIWNGLNAYRGKLIDIVCKSATVISKIEADSGQRAKTYSFKDPMLGTEGNEFTSPSEIHEMLTKKGALKNVKDEFFVAELYASLCKNEMSEDEETGEKFHWIGRTFDHAPGVAVLAAISSLQKEVLKARSEVMIHLQSEVGGSDYSFNKVVGLARPMSPIVAGGQEFFVEIQAAAYDSERDPVVDTKGQGQIVSVKNGIALVKFRAPSSGTMNIQGTIAIKKKTGGEKKMEYSTEVAVAPKTGALELPECNVLYMNYDNIIVPAAPGVTDLSLSGGRGTTYEGKKAFIVRPTTPGKKLLSLSGKGADGKTVNIGSWTYKVKEMPPAVITTSTITKAGGRVAVAMAGGVLNVTYTILNGICDETRFNGGMIPAAAVSKIRSGKSVTVILNVKNNKTGKPEAVKGVIKVQ